MGKYLRDAVLSCAKDLDPHFNFKLQTNFLEILYLDCLPKVQTDGVSKIIVRACKVLPSQKLENMGDVLQLNKRFDFYAYFAAEKGPRKRIALEFLQAGLLEVAVIRGWDTSPFHEAYKAVLAKNLVNYRPWIKPVSSPNRKHKAQVWCNYESDKAEIFIVIFRRNEIVNKTLVTTVKPGDVWIRGAVGKLAWLSSDKVKLTSHDGKESWETTLPMAT